MSSSIAISESEVVPQTIPWENKPHGVVSLLDMLRFYAEDYLGIVRILGGIDATMHAHRNDPAIDLRLSEVVRAQQRETLPWFGDLCKKIHLDSAFDQTKRMLERVNDEHDPCTNREYAQLNNDLHNRVVDDFARHILFAIPRAQGAYFEQKGTLYGDKVAKAFPSAMDDIEEAGKCYATDRSTACVFHLMHVTEFGLRAMAKALNDPTLDPQKNPSWENILRKCDLELQKPIKDRSALWAVKDQFFSQATANLRSVKNAWRNPSMHVGKKYNPDEALDILNAVGGFIRHLAIELHE